MRWRAGTEQECVLGIHSLAPRESGSGPSKEESGEKWLWHVGVKWHMITRCGGGEKSLQKFAEPGGGQYDGGRGEPCEPLDSPRLRASPRRA